MRDRKNGPELPEGDTVITPGLTAPSDSARVAAKAELCPGRRTRHIVVSTPEESDEEWFSRVREAYIFADRKRGARR